MDMTVSMADEPLIILAVTDRYPIGQIEEEIFRTAQIPRPFKLISHDLDDGVPLSEIPHEIASSVDGLFLLRHYFTKEDVERFSRLKCIVRTGVGYDRVDRAAIAEASITLHNVPDYGTAEIADHAMALTLSLRRGIVLHHDDQRSHDAAWTALDNADTFPLRGLLMQRSSGRIVGIIGLGRIGTAFALRAKAFNFKVIFHDPYVPNGIDIALGIERIRNIDDLFRRADIISLHCHHTPETRHLVNTHSLSLVKPESILINTARGELIHLDALYAALKERRLLAAGLDVIEVEPPKDPLPALLRAYREGEEWLLGRLIITPHVAYFSRDSLTDMRLKSAETMRDALFDRLPTNLVECSFR